MATVQNVKLLLQSYLPLQSSIKTVFSLLDDCKAEYNRLSFLTDCSSDYIAKNDLIIYLENLIIEKSVLCKSIIEKIEDIPSETEKNILILKYLCGYTWEEISEKTNYSLRQVYNIHSKALLHIKNTSPE